MRRRLPVSRSRVVIIMAILPIWSLVPELACLSASSPPSSFQSSMTGRKPPTCSSFKSSLTGRRRRASRHRLADYSGHRSSLVPRPHLFRFASERVWQLARLFSVLMTFHSQKMEMTNVRVAIERVTMTSSRPRKVEQAARPSQKQSGRGVVWERD